MAHPGIIAVDVDVVEEYGIGNDFRMGADIRVLNVDVL